MQPPVFQVLKSSTAVKAIIGTNPPRIYRHGAAPQRSPDETIQAYITWFVVTGTPENHLSGTPPVDRVTIQVDYWHPTDAGVVLLAEAGRDAIEPFAHMTAEPIDDRDPDTKLYRIGQQFDWFNDRAF